MVDHAGWDVWEGERATPTACGSATSGSLAEAARSGCSTSSPTPTW